MCLATVPRLELTADDLWARHQLTQEHPSLATRRNAAFAEVERRLADEIARRTGLDLDRDPYPTLVVTAASGALKAACRCGRSAAARDPLAELIDEAFRTIASGFALPVAVTAG